MPDCRKKSVRHRHFYWYSTATVPHQHSSIRVSLVPLVTDLTDIAQLCRDPTRRKLRRLVFTVMSKMYCPYGHGPSKPLISGKVYKTPWIIHFVWYRKTKKKTVAGRFCNAYLLFWIFDPEDFLLDLYAPYFDSPRMDLTLFGLRPNMSKTIRQKNLKKIKFYHVDLLNISINSHKAVKLTISK